jgi:hypothetical protein
MNDPMTTSRVSVLACLAAALALGAGACGDLDDVTTVKDLRVLAMKSEPAGFLVPLDNPASLADMTATLTSLVVDPKKPSDILTLTGEACPDYIDTITAASGQTSKLCPSAAVTDKFPSPFDSDLATTELPPGTAVPILNSMIEYDPQIVFSLGNNTLGKDKLTDFFVPSPQTALFPPINNAVLYNRDFGFDVLVNLTFVIGDETAAGLKRIVYWPELPADVLLTGIDPKTGKACPPTQVANTNPDLLGVSLYQHRVDGIPMDRYPDGVMPTISIANDQLFVEPAFDPAAAESYFLRVHNADTGMIETQCRKELLTFQFFASAGSFSPAERRSELSPILTPPANGHIPIDSQYNPPKAADIPADGNVTVWIVTRDERAGVSWSSHDFALQP